MALPEQYEYLRLQDAIVAVGQKVNFFGVVREYDQPKPTRGSDLVCTMTVEDMSYNRPGLRVIVFSSEAHNIPRVKSVGDIIRFHRVLIGNHNNSPQAVVKMKYGAAFVLFSGKKEIGYTPYQVSSKRYTFRDYDERIIDLMRGWIEIHPIGTGVSDYIIPISMMKEGSYFDLCCKVLVIDRREPDHALVLYVWDGTDAPPAHVTPMQETDRREGQHSDTIHGHLALLPRDIVCGFPPLGSVVSIVPDIPIEELPIQLPEPGNWVKFRNLTCRVHFGIFEAIFLRESKISLLPSTHGLVKEHERSYHDRLQSDDGHLPQWSPKPLRSITVIDYEHVPVSTLREALIRPQVTCKFHCLVRVVAIWPTNVEDFCTFKEPQNIRHEFKANLVEHGSRDEYVYRLRLTLEDPTARIYAFLHGEDAARFFNGHSAAELQGCSVTVGALRRKVNKLLGFEEYHSHETGKLERRQYPPWIKCCLKSYYLEKGNLWESRRFRIFGTALPG